MVFGGIIMKEIVIISAVRTPIGKFQGALKSLTAPQLGALVVRAAVERAGLAPEQIDEVIMGNVVSAGLGQNPARQAALRGGLLPDVAAMTINKVCGSGLKAVGLAAQGIQTGDSEIVVAGGMESMTNAPYLLPGAREGYRLGHGTIVDSMIHDGLWDAYENFHMGNTGEIVAEQYHVSPRTPGRIRAQQPSQSRRRDSRRTASGTKSFPCRFPSAKAIRCCSIPTNLRAPMPRSKRCAL